jgi:hypothetical protein
MMRHLTEKTRAVVAVLALGLAFIGCAAKPYEKQYGTTAQAGNALVRYGTIAGAGAAGGAIGYLASDGDPLVTGLGAAAGTAAGVGITAFNDKKKMEAYNQGVRDGEAQGRAQAMKEVWQAQAIDGPAGPTGPRSNHGGGRAGSPTLRRVYVPAREVNGVKYPGGYQSVQVAPQP